MNTQVTCQTQKNTAKEAERSVYRRPTYNIAETDSAFAVTVDLPGVEKSAVDIATENGVLSIKASRNAATPKDAKVISQAAQVDGYQLSLKLGPQVDVQNIKASLENGVLTLQLNKAAEAQARRITVA